MPFSTGSGEPLGWFCWSPPIVFAVVFLDWREALFLAEADRAADGGLSLELELVLWEAERAFSPLAEVSDLLDRKERRSAGIFGAQRYPQRLARQGSVSGTRSSDQTAKGKRRNQQEKNMTSYQASRDLFIFLVGFWWWVVVWELMEMKGRSRWTEPGNS
jgi:hypothetical protein